MAILKTHAPERRVPRRPARQTGPIPAPPHSGPAPFRVVKNAAAL